ncbi:MAG: ABC transporter permease [Lachnospiraceae bacterium]|nr:ABC transporter permease [Lachnospiraceae bacterium]MBO7599763.1 ABC transporter permease [Lachnospiraceae bacterium]
MAELLEKYLPNLMERIPEFLKSIVDTLKMVGLSGIFVFVLGVFLGVLLITTKPGGILEKNAVYQVIDKVINAFRSIPFVILISLLLPLTRAIVHTSIGVKGAIVPLVIGTIPFFARQVEAALAQIDGGVVEAADALGMKPIDIIFKVYLREGIPALSRATTITAINLLGLTAMAGAVGAGGLGDFAIRYGHNRYMTDITWVTTIVLIIFVCIIQIVGNFIAKRSTH